MQRLGELFQFHDIQKIYIYIAKSYCMYTLYVYILYTFVHETTRPDSPTQSSSHSSASALSEAPIRTYVHYHRGHLAALAPFPSWVYDMYDAQVRL